MTTPIKAIYRPIGTAYASSPLLDRVNEDFSTIVEMLFHRYNISLEAYCSREAPNSYLKILKEVTGSDEISEESIAKVTTAILTNFRIALQIPRDFNRQKYTDTSLFKMLTTLLHRYRELGSQRASPFELLNVNDTDEELLAKAKRGLVVTIAPGGDQAHALETLRKMVKNVSGPRTKIQAPEVAVKADDTMQILTFESRNLKYVKPLSLTSLADASFSDPFVLNIL